MKTIIFVLKSLSVFALVEISCFVFSKPAYSQNESPKQELCVNSKPKTVKILLDNNKWGSGVLISRDGNQYTLVTNGHVLHGNKEEYTIETSDKQPHQAFVLARFDQHKNYGTDLAALRFDSPIEYQTFKLSQWKQGERVMAVGFPINPLPSSDDHGFFCTNIAEKSFGLPEPMKKGYQVGYFINVPHGLSGGGLVNDRGELIGINGMINPSIFVNPDVYKFRDDKTVSKYIAKELNISEDESLKRLSKSSWAIPIESVVSLLPRSVNIPNIPLSISFNARLDRAFVDLVSTNTNSQTSIAKQAPTSNLDTSINSIAKNITVSIGVLEKISKGQIFDPRAAAVLIAKNKTNYYVLVNAEKVSQNRQYAVSTPDRKVYSAKIIWKAPELGLAIFGFTSDLNYQVAEILDLANVSSELTLNIIGWVIASNGNRVQIMLKGSLVDLEALKSGKTFVYQNLSDKVLSSGVILDSNGQLIGLHKVFRSDIKIGEGIPIYTFLKYLPDRLQQMLRSQKNPLPSCDIALFGKCTP
jgi:S1-C subfamily serine protease